MPVTELCGQEESFVLLAADGTGKTTVLRSLQAREPGAVEVNLSTLDKVEIREKLEAAVARGGPVYLDAVDFAARLEPAGERCGAGRVVLCLRYSPHRQLAAARAAGVHGSRRPPAGVLPRA